MARRGLVDRVALAAAVVGAGWTAGACTRCDVDCAAPSRVEEVVAEVRSSDVGLVRVRTEAGDDLDVRLFGGSPSDLEVGTSYRFPLLFLEPGSADGTVDAGAPDASATTATSTAPEGAADAAAGPVAFFPDDCDCTDEYISDLDGDVIDPGVDIPFRMLSIAFIAGAFALVALWGASRWYREVPL